MNIHTASWLIQVLNRYGTPETRTWELVRALEPILDLDYSFVSSEHILDLVDVIRGIVPKPTVQDAKIAAYLIGQGYEAEDIKCACICLAYGGPAFRCVRVKAEDEVAINKLLETKP